MSDVYVKVDYNNNNIFLFDLVYQESAMLVAQALIYFNDIEMKKEASLRKDVKLYIDSQGGNSDSMFGLISVINSLDIKIHGIGVGQISSAAIAILASCHERSMYEGTSGLLHQVQRGYRHDSLTANEIRMKFTKQMDDMYFDVIKRESKVPASIIKKVREGQEVWLTSKLFLEYGLVDKIIPDKKVRK